MIDIKGEGNGSRCFAKPNLCEQGFSRHVVRTCCGIPFVVHGGLNALTVGDRDTIL